MADNTQFSTSRIKALGKLYSDEMSTRRRYDKTTSYSTVDYNNAAEVRKALKDAVANKDTIVEASKKLYVTNPIYAAIINYLTDMYTWQYKVIPHKLYTKSKAKARKEIKIDDYMIMYNLMLEITEGLSLKNKVPSLLQRLFTEGSVFFTTISDDESLTIDTLILPSKYCRQIGETQFGTAIIAFDMSYFRDQGLTEDKLKDYFKSFPKEFELGYRAFLKDSQKRWCELDPRFSSGVMMNELGIPTYIYVLGGILDFEKYQDNELERNENALKYLVVHTIPHYEDQLIFEVDEVAAIHKSLRKIVDTGDKARLITTYGDIKVEKIAENETTENQVLSKAFTAIFNNAGFNSGIFTSESVEALKMSLVRDKGMVWKYAQQLISFYNIAVNNWFDFKGYQADIDFLPISSYTYKDDIEIFKTNASLGVNKLDYLIASGIEQKNISDVLTLEKILRLDQIVPMQTSYTQTAEDRNASKDDDTQEEKSNESVEDKSVIEPSDSDSKETKDNSSGREEN